MQCHAEPCSAMQCLCLCLYVLYQNPSPSNQGPSAPRDPHRFIGSPIAPRSSQACQSMQSKTIGKGAETSFVMQTFQSQCKHLEFCLLCSRFCKPIISLKLIILNSGNNDTAFQDHYLANSSFGFAYKGLCNHRSAYHRPTTASCFACESTTGLPNLSSVPKSQHILNRMRHIV